MDAAERPELNMTVGDLRRILEGFRQDLPISLDVADSFAWVRDHAPQKTVHVALSCEYEGELKDIVWRRLPDGPLICEERDLWEGAISEGLIEEAFPVEPDDDEDGV
jgi:hypothetical protein